MIPSPNRLIFASNEDWVVPAGRDSRRFVVPEVSHHRAGDHQYFRDLVEHINNGGREAFFDFLMSRKITNDVRKAVITQGLVEQRLLSMSSEETFWREILDSGQVLGGDKTWSSYVLKEDLYAQYTAFVKERGYRRANSKQLFFRKVYEMCPPMKASGPRVDVNGSRVRQLTLPPLAEARGHFEAHINGPVDWDDAAGAAADDDIPF